MNLLTKLEKRKDIWSLLLLSSLFSLLRVPSLFEPYWYGDEGIYQAMGDAMNSGRLLYSEVWDNKPPLLYALYALFHSDQFTIRLVSLLFGLGAITIFFLLSQRLFKALYARILSVSIFAILLGLPFIEGNIANAENFILLPIIFSVYSIVKQSDTIELRSRLTTIHTFFSPHLIRKLFLPGLCCGIAFLFKIVALFDFMALLTLVFFLSFSQPLSFSTLRKELRTYVSGIRLFITGFFLPLILTSLYFLLRGSFMPFFQSSFLGNINYVGYSNTFVIPQGLLLIKLFCLALAVCIIFLFRKKLPLSLLIILTWVSYSLFNVFFAQRPYAHYLLVILPSLSLLMGSTVEYKQWQKPLSILTMGILFLLVTIFKIYAFRNPVPYYVNFLSYVTGQKSVNSYRDFFDKNVNKNYLIAEYLKVHTNPQDVVYLWGNSAQVYHLSHTIPPGKYVVAYHVAYNKLAIRETERAIESTRPRFLVIQPDESTYPFSLDGYVYKLTILDAQIYEKVY
ncbi:hypothetical protein BH11PAT1_BH11PAT1_6910 [soil metagenome]